MLRQGDIEARRADNSGALWGGIARAVGDVPMQISQARAAEAKAKEDAYDRDISRANIVSQIDARGAASQAASAKALTDEQARKLAQQHAKVSDWLGSLAGIADPDEKKAAYLQGRTAFLTDGTFTEQDAPSAFPGDSWVKSRMAMLLPAADKFKALFPEAPKVGTKTVEVKNADGSVTTKIVADTPGQDFTGAPPVVAPKKHAITVLGPHGEPIEKLVTEEELAKGIPGYRAPVQNPQRDRFNIQQITRPDGTTGLVRVNMDTGEVSEAQLPNGAGSGHATDTQRLSAAYLDRTKASDVTAAGFEKALSALGPQFNVRLPNMLKSEDGQRYKQAKDEFINAALRRESGAAIQPSEYARFDNIYFVTPGDTAATIRQKQVARQRVIDGFKVAAGNMGVAPKADAPPAGAGGRVNPFLPKKK